jgi:predicted AAA+ superfamily ATPase
VRTEDFKSVISEFLTYGIPEVRERELKLPLEPNITVTVSGGRRGGKTSLLYETMRRVLDNGLAQKDEILYVDLEHPRLRGSKVEELDDMLVAFRELTGKSPKYLFLDEIQVVQGYGTWFRRRLDAKIYLTGSSSSLTPRKVAEELRGRSVNFEVLPLSFREYLSFLGVKVNRDLALYSDERGRLLSLLMEYLTFGGYPAVVLERDPVMKRMILRSYFDSVVVRDLGGTPQAEAVARILISGYSTMLSINKLYNSLRGMGFPLSKEKLIEMLRRAEESYFYYPVEIFERSERKRRVNPRKTYIVDTGYSMGLGYEFSISRAMENAVYLELRRRGYQPYYWKEYGKAEGAEVDFVVSDNFRARELIQVTYAKDRIEEREIRALKKASAELNPERMTIITWNHRGEMEGVRAIPLWYWLLEKM